LKSILKLKFLSYSIKPFLKNLIGLFIFLILLVACSTEKASFLNRKYHGTTARYNGLFNANELLAASLKTYNASIKDNFYAVLPVNPITEQLQDIMGFSMRTSYSQHRLKHITLQLKITFMLYFL